ncbi:uncharacterized protein LOC114310690 [Camellia sinensis]|uniref:uncharacterized protein LOC114310690 n=1 Tax=Camellia sinensis TaxID=4442 RepID=UPI00103584C1|nr:uncharacterized protein LOC114310690 [Camellia sinensis]
MKLIRKRLKTVQSCQKSYVDIRRRDREYGVGDHVFIKVTPMKGQKRFGVKGKLAPRYIRAYEILEKISSVIYQVTLPPVMENMHNIFHISMLRDYLRDALHVMEPTHVLLKYDYMYEETNTDRLPPNQEIKKQGNSIGKSRLVES